MSDQSRINQYFSRNTNFGGYGNSSQDDEERPLISYYTRHAATDDYDDNYGANATSRARYYETEILPNRSSTMAHQKIADVEKKKTEEGEMPGTAKGKVKRVLSDFEIITRQKREERITKRNRADENNLLKKNEETMARILAKMKDAAEKDKRLNASFKPATKKVTLLPQILPQLRKPEIQLLYKEYDVLSVFANWLLPLKGKALPALIIRESILDLLLHCPPIDNGSLKHSGIGKAVNYLRKHLNETPENKEKAKILYDRWFRGILNLPINKKNSRKVQNEREKNMEQMEKRQKMDNTFDMLKRVNSDSGVEVPSVSNKVYTVRPQSNVLEPQPVKPTEGPMDRISKRMKKTKESGHQVSIDGKQL